MREAKDGGGDADDARVLKLARRLVVALVAGVLVLMVLSRWMPRREGLDVLVLLAALGGAVSPVIGYRLYRVAADAACACGSREKRRQAFLRAQLLATGVTEAAAVFGVIIHALTADPFALIGVLMHVLLAGALWPSQEKLSLFLEAPPLEPREG